jgi:hypothetical protein
VEGWRGETRGLRRGESGGVCGRREKSYIRVETGDLAVALPEEMYDKTLPSGVSMNKSDVLEYPG